MPFVALDIGGTKLVAASWDESGTLLEKVRRPTPRPLEEGLDLLHEMIADVARSKRPIAIGAAAGGPLDWKAGVASPLHQPEWRDVPLKRIIEERWRCPFAVYVDTNVAALGEFDVLPSKPDRMLFVTVSTGMGGSLLIDGEIYRGAGDDHPEIGHQAIPHRVSNPQGVACECGLDDCLEAVVSGNGIRRIYGKPAESLTVAEWDEVSANLGIGLRNAAVAYLPSLIVLGGSVSLGGGPRLLERVRRALEDQMRIVTPPAVAFSRLGDDAPLLGAHRLARSMVPA